MAKLATFFLVLTAFTPHRKRAKIAAYNDLASPPGGTAVQHAHPTRVRRPGPLGHAQLGSTREERHRAAAATATTAAAAATGHF